MLPLGIAAAAALPSPPSAPVSPKRGFQFMRITSIQHFSVSDPVKSVPHLHAPITTAQVIAIFPTFKQQQIHTNHQKILENCS